MKQSLENSQQKPYVGEKPPNKSGGASILDFPRKEERAGGERWQSYEEYKALPGGVLTQEQYQNVLRSVAKWKGIPANSLSAEHANFMAQIAWIPLSPETITVYEILSHGNPGQENEYRGGMSDQKLLAEALRIIGDTHSLTEFIEKNVAAFH